ncbi:MAG: glutathione S-transferase family protein [Polyangiaceae bacterium]
MPEYRLITIGPSHFCEKARWALTRTRVPFVEEAHAPGFHLFHTKKLGGRSVPVLVTDTRTLVDSTDILELCDRHSSGGLYGSGEVRRQATELEERFDTELGPHTRRLAYFHVLGEKALMLDAVRAQGSEAALFRAGYPGIVALMRKSMKIDAAGAARSRERILALYRELGERLSDGRRYLTGDRFTAADLTFAALSAPVIVPPEYGWPLPPLEALGTAMSSEVRHLRDSVAGEFALRLYREDRKVVPAIGES